MLTDPISDMLTRIKNAYAAHKDEVVLPSSKIKLAIANLLKNNGYLFEVAEEGDKKKNLRLKLSYKRNEAAVTNVKRVSKPGRRVYASAKELPSVLSGFGIAVVSTPKGIMTNKDARKMNVGGEIICEIY